MTAGSTATHKCYVDNVLQWNASTVMNAATLGGFEFAGLGTGPTVTIDDIFWFDASSPSPTPADMPLGGRMITTLRPSGDDTVQFTRSAGSDNYALVDETVANSDTDYVQDNVSGHQDLYNFTDISFAPVSISAVNLAAVSMNPGGGVQNHKLRCKSSATTSDSASIMTPLSYQGTRFILNQDPATSTAWTQSGLNAAKFGITIP